jgi:hypothetical protein
VLVCGCGSDAPSTDGMPLAPGLRVVSHEVREGVTYDSPHANYLLIVGPHGAQPASLRSQEVGHLRQIGWNVHKHFHDGSWAVTSPDGKVWADVGFGLGSYCGFGGTNRKALRGYPSICVTFVNH